jgi:hypothetical protein
MEHGSVCVNVGVAVQVALGESRHDQVLDQMGNANRAEGLMSSANSEDK